MSRREMRKAKRQENGSKDRKKRQERKGKGFRKDGGKKKIKTEKRNGFIDFSKYINN